MQYRIARKYNPRFSKARYKKSDSFLRNRKHLLANGRDISLIVEDLGVGTDLLFSLVFVFISVNDSHSSMWALLTQGDHGLKIPRYVERHYVNTSHDCK